MPSAAFPTVIAALVSTAQAALPGSSVVRGRDLSDETADVVMVGVSDLVDATGWDSAGSFDQAFQTFGGGREEKGVVNGLVLARRGDNDPAAAEEAAFDLLSDLNAAVRADPSLGVTSLDYVVAELQSGSVQESLSDGGVAVVLPFAVFYKSRF